MSCRVQCFVILTTSHYHIQLFPNDATSSFFSWSAVLANVKYRVSVFALLPSHLVTSPALLSLPMSRLLLCCPYQCHVSCSAVLTNVTSPALLSLPMSRLLLCCPYQCHVSCSAVLTNVTSRALLSLPMSRLVLRCPYQCHVLVVFQSLLSLSMSRSRRVSVVAVIINVTFSSCFSRCCPYQCHVLVVFQ